MIGSYLAGARLGKCNVKFSPDFTIFLLSKECINTFCNSAAHLKISLLVLLIYLLVLR